MKRAWWVVLVMVLGCGDDGGSAVPDAPVVDDDLTVMLDTGPIHGFVKANARTFLALPFAAPPVGELRWKAPRRPPRGPTSARSTSPARRARRTPGLGCSPTTRTASS